MAHFSRMFRRMNTIKFLKIIFVIFGVGLSTAICGFCSVIAFFIYYDHQNDVSFEKYLSNPLPPAVLNDLCSRKLLPVSIGNCTDKNLVVEQQYTPAIFRANLEENSDYDDVRKLFGSYELECQKETSLDVKEYTCQYRLGGYDVILIFNAITNKIESIIQETKGS
jgi:hypothetical protein